jgi:hypothetical protein
VLASVVVGVQTDQDLLALRYVSVKIFHLYPSKCELTSKHVGAHLISEMIRRCDFDSSWQIKYDSTQSVRTRSSPRGLDGVANFHGELGFRLRESLWAIFVSEDSSVLCSALVGETTDEFRVLRGELNGLLFRVFENDASEQWACRVVHMNDGLLGACDRVDGPRDQILPCRRQNLWNLHSSPSPRERRENQPGSTHRLEPAFVR